MFNFVLFVSLLTVTKFIRIGIADKNDNPPYFDKALYEAEVDENEDIQHTVLTVTAKDHDECKYPSTSNGGLLFPLDVVLGSNIRFLLQTDLSIGRKVAQLEICLKVINLNKSEHL